MRKKTGNVYDTIKIPRSITNMCDVLVKDHGYTSRTDVVKYAVRKLYENVKEKYT